MYVDETVSTSFEMWNGAISETKPEYRPHSAWLLPANISTITLTISKPAPAVDEVKTLAGGGVIYSGSPGKWVATFNTDGGAGRYWIDWRGVTTDGHSSVTVEKVTAKARP